jgi:hypothetical protein
MAMDSTKGKSLAATMGTIVAAILCVIVVLYMFSYFGTTNRANSPADRSQTSGLSTQQRDKTPKSEGPATTTTGVPEGGAGSDSTRSTDGPSGKTENTGSAPRNGQ